MTYAKIVLTQETHETTLKFFTVITAIKHSFVNVILRSEPCKILNTSLPSIILNIFKVTRWANLVKFLFQILPVLAGYEE